MNNLYLVLLVFLLYWLLVKVLDRKGILEQYNITAYGPILMIRTQRGQEFLDRLAVYKNFWRLFANIGLPAMIIGMIVMFLLIVFIDYSMLSSFQADTVPQPNKFNEPRNLFLIPGLNEFIPFKWGLIALIITLVVHEFAHAILCKVEGIRVKSMGLLLAMIPIGGFAEPDEEQLLGKQSETEEEGAETKKMATRNERVRVLTAGVMANFVTAAIAFILFFSLLGSLSPVGDVTVVQTVSGYPAEDAGVKPNMIITSLNGVPITSAHDFLISARKLEPGAETILGVVENGTQKEISLTISESTETVTGVRIFKVLENTPAEAAGFKPNMVMFKINDTNITGLEDFIKFMGSTSAGQEIEVHTMSNNSANATLQVFSNVKLDQYPYDPTATKGFLGVSYAPEGFTSYSVGVSIAQFPATKYLNGLKAVPSMLNGATGWLMLFSLPLMGGPDGEIFTGFTGMLTSYYANVGWADAIGMNIFWLLTVLLWVGWMNFYVGLFNCLPAVPLDGGHVFRDVMTATLSRFMSNGDKVERVSNAIVVVFAVLILMSFVFVIIAPFMAHGF